MIDHGSIADPRADTRIRHVLEGYPRKIGKGAARKAWAKATDRPPILAVILANIQAHVDSDQWQREGGQFIPHPATWLNQKRWDDDLPKGRPRRQHPNRAGA